MGLDKVFGSNFIREIVDKAFANLDFGQGSSSPSLPTIKPALDPETIEKQNWLRILRHPFTAIIIGGRGKGKSALGYRILEYLHWQLETCVVGLPKATRKYLPDYIHMYATLEEVPAGYAILVDEGYLDFHARRSMSKISVAMSKIINLSRQRNQTIIVVTQEARQIDINIVSQTDVLILKKPSMLQPKFERSPLRDFVIKANLAFAPMPRSQRKQYSYAIAEEAEYEGLMKNSLPSFWRPALSRIHSTAGEVITIPGKKISKQQKIEKAKELKLQGLSLGKIAKIMGVTKPTVKNYLEDYPYKA